MDIGTVIKERRALLGISQQDLSDYSGVGISTVKDLERGVGNPSSVVTDTTEDTGCGGYGNGVTGKTDR